MKAIVSQKGQITIPKRLRDRLGIHPGTVLEFEERQGRLVARKSGSPRDPVLEVSGILGQVVDTDRYLDEVRGPVR